MCVHVIVRTASCFAEVSDTSSLTSPGADSEPDFGWQQSWLSSRIIAVSCLSMWPRVDCSIAITSVSCQVFVGTVDNRRDPKKYNHNPALGFLVCFRFAEDMKSYGY